MASERRCTTTTKGSDIRSYADKKLRNRIKSTQCGVDACGTSPSGKLVSYKRVIANSCTRCDKIFCDDHLSPKAYGTVDEDGFCKLGDQYFCTERCAEKVDQEIKERHDSEKFKATLLGLFCLAFFLFIAVARYFAPEPLMIGPP